MRTVYLTSVVLHIAAMAVWLGALVTLAFAVLPVVRRETGPDQALGLTTAVGERLRWITWSAFALLFVTGVVQVVYRVEPETRLFELAWWAGPWGRLLAVKLGFFAVLLGLAAFHDFVLGPRAGRAEGEALARLRRRASWFGRAELGVSLVIVVLGVMLVRGPY